MTMSIDDTLLHKAMRISGIASKTAAVDLALREFVRRGDAVRVLSAGLDKSPRELGEMFDPAYDLEALRLAEKPTPHGRKPRSR